MKAPKYIIAISFCVMCYLVFRGPKITVVAGELNMQNNSYYFYTSSRSLATLIQNSSQLNSVCPDKLQCLQARHGTRFEAGLPIEFEHCPNQKIIIHSCENPKLQFTVNSAKWLQMTVRKK